MNIVNKAYMTQVLHTLNRVYQTDIFNYSMSEFLRVTLNTIIYY